MEERQWNIGISSAVTLDGVYRPVNGDIIEGLNADAVTGAYFKD